MKGRTITLLLTGLLVSMLPVAAHANTRTWNGTTGNWTDADRWGGTVPQHGETAVLNSDSILLDSSTADLAAFNMNGGTLTLANWDTALTATNVTINGGTLTLPPAFTDFEMSNRVYVVCSNITLGANAIINVDNRGFKASMASGGTAYGPGAPASSAHYGAGAGHGGVGGYGDSGPTPGGPIYGQTNAPTVPGSGGGGVSGGHGGGAVRIDAVGRVTINGIITTKGGNVSSINNHGGAGSGGSIFISCARFEGAASGRLIADGGRSTSLGQTLHGGSGGGGRIAVAIGVSPTDVQKLIDGDPVGNVFTTDRCAGYAGSYSVAKGVPL